MTYQTEEKKVLILYYSFSSQTKNLLQAFIEGIKEHQIKVSLQRLEPIQPLRFPVGNIYSTVKMMLFTFFRKRIPIQPLDSTCFDNYDLTVLAGPTWSYNPSGPILSLLDSDGSTLFEKKKCLRLFPVEAIGGLIG